MKLKKINFVLFSVLLILGSCSGNDHDGGYSKLENEIHHIKIEMSISEPDVPVHVVSHAGVITIKDKWEYEYDTKDYFAQFSGTVIEEENHTGRKVIIKANIYVDGKLKKTFALDTFLEITIRIKGECPPWELFCYNSACKGFQITHCS